jgi:hypothetical protein
MLGKFYVEAEETVREKYDQPSSRQANSWGRAASGKRVGVLQSQPALVRENAGTSNGWRVNHGPIETEKLPYLVWPPTTT